MLRWTIYPSLPPENVPKIFRIKIRVVRDLGNTLPDVKIVTVFAGRLVDIWVFIIWEWGQIGSIHMLIATIKLL